MEGNEKTAVAELRHARISARKVKIVIDLIRGKSAKEAIAILKYTNKAALIPKAEYIPKFIQSMPSWSAFPSSSPFHLTSHKSLPHFNPCHKSKIINKVITKQAPPLFLKYVA